MKNEMETVVLRPANWIMGLCFGIPWLLPVCSCVFPYLCGTASAIRLDWGEARLGLFAALLNVYAAFLWFNVRITLLPGGKIRYKQVGFQLEDPDEDPAAEFYVRNNMVPRDMRIGGVPVGKSKKRLRWIQQEQELYPGEIRRFGYTQRMFRKKEYALWKKVLYRQYLTVILQNDRRLEWRLTGFRAAEIEQIKAHIRKYNPEVKFYF